MRKTTARPGLRETDITRSILDLLHSLDIFAYKHWQGAFSKPGISDIVGCLKEQGGRGFWIEVKKPGGKLSPEQAAFLANVNQAGGIAFKAESVEDVIKGLGLERRVLL